MKRPNPRESARHEAAHALIAFLSGIPLQSCEIRSRPVAADERRFVTLGFSRLTGDEDEKLKALLQSPGELTEDQRAYLTRHLHFAVAGFVAEQHAGTSSQETTGADRRSALLTVGRLCGGRIVGDGITARVHLPDGRQPETVRVLGAAEEHVRTLLADHEAAWDGLASLLMNHGSLTGEQVVQFLTTQLGRRQ